MNTKLTIPQCMKKFGRFVFIGIILGFLSQSYAQPAFILGKQFGTKEGDSGQDLVIYRSGEIVLAGTTSGNLCSDNLGEYDGYIMKMDSMGNEIWKRQFGTDRQDKVWELEEDTNENLYVSGITLGTIGGKSYGEQDIFIYKFNNQGDLLESKIFGTDSIDFMSEIYIDDFNNIYIAGNTKGKIGKESYGDWDYFIMKLDSNFSIIYTLQFGTDKWDCCNDFIIDKHNDIYICGFTMGNLGRDNLGKKDAFIAKYSQQGELIMMRQFGTEQAENVSNILIDAENNLYLSGTSHGNIVNENKGKSDVFMMKINNSGDVIWERQFGTSSWDEAWHMDFINSDEGLILSGSNNPDAYIRRYDLHGNLIWNQVFAARGIKAGTGGRHFSIYQNKYVYYTGFTFANLFSQNLNQETADSFIVKLGLSDEQN